METRTKRMRKVKAAHKRRASRNKIQYKKETIPADLLKEREELLNDREEYSIR